MLTLLAGPGVVWELVFVSWVLLQLEYITACAQTVIRTLQADEHQRGWLKSESDNGKKPVRQIVFAGERSDVMSVRWWREKVLGRR